MATGFLGVGFVCLRMKTSDSSHRSSCNMRLFSRSCRPLPREGKGKGVGWPWCSLPSEAGARAAASEGQAQGPPGATATLRGQRSSGAQRPGSRWRPCLARAGSAGPVTPSLGGSLVVLACMAPGTLCNEVEAWGPCGGQQQAALPPLASFKPHVSLSREGLVLVVPPGPHPNTGLKRGWALPAIIPLMLGGSGRRILPFSRAFCPEHLHWCLGVPAPRCGSETSWMLAAGSPHPSQPALCRTLVSTTATELHVSAWSWCSPTALCAAAGGEHVAWALIRASDNEEGNLESDAFPSQCPATLDAPLPFTPSPGSFPFRSHSLWKRHACPPGV